MANKNTNPGGGKDDNEMRIQFGLILALCQNCAISHNPLFHAQNSNLFKGLSPAFPARYIPYFAITRCRKRSATKFLSNMVSFQAPIPTLGISHNRTYRAKKHAVYFIKLNAVERKTHYFGII